MTLRYGVTYRGVRGAVGAGGIRQEDWHLTTSTSSSAYSSLPGVHRVEGVFTQT